MRKPWIRGRSDKSSKIGNQEDHADDSNDPPENPEPLPSHDNETRDKKADGLRPHQVGSNLANGGQPDEVLNNLWWQIGQAGRSLGISALAAGIVVLANWLDPGHMKQWHVFSSVGLYIAGVWMFFRIEQREHRKCRAMPPVDPFGGARFALIFVALLFCTSPRPATDGLADLFALAALLLGSLSDGTWIAIVATRQRIGFWRAWYHIAVKEREAQRRLWAVLIGRDRR